MTDTEFMTDEEFEREMAAATARIRWMNRMSLRLSLASVAISAAAMALLAWDVV
jgi:preprotein translocase subunit SecE